MHFFIFLLFLFCQMQAHTCKLEEPLNTAFTITRKGLPVQFWVAFDAQFRTHALFSLEMKENGEWTTPIRISEVIEDIHGIEKISVSGSGQITAVWHSSMSQHSHVVREATLSLGGIWDSPRTVIESLFPKKFDGAK